MCKFDFDSPSAMKKHLRRSHYKNEILKGGSFVQNCLVCQRLSHKKSSGTLAPNEVWGMAQHLGLSHGYLEKVLPDSVKRALELMESGRNF